MLLEELEVLSRVVLEATTAIGRMPAGGDGKVDDGACERLGQTACERSGVDLEGPPRVLSSIGLAKALV